MIEKFKTYENKIKDKDIKNLNLSDDILFVDDEKDQYTKIKEPVEVIQITGIITDEDEIKKIEENFTPDLTNQIYGDIKRGQIIYLTALLKRTGNVSFNAQTMGVVKCRVVDLYYGLNVLKNIIK